MSYAIFFDYNNKTYRLPTNPETIEESSTMNIEKYEVLKLGQVAVPTHLELKEYSFECEFPSNEYNYILTKNKFKDADYYINKFETWREKLEPIRFIASNDIGNDINTLVLLTELSITEKAGEEGDKYIAFKLTEYKEHGKKMQVTTKSGKKVKQKIKKETTNPKNTGYYVVKKGDNLWSIAKKYYGDGSKYTKIYNANKDKIKNPALIYPGQKLTIPS